MTSVFDCRLRNAEYKLYDLGFRFWVERFGFTGCLFLVPGFKLSIEVGGKVSSEASGVAISPRFIDHLPCSYVWIN